MAATMHKVEIRSGSTTSFCFANWSDLGHLYDLTGHRGIIDTGIPLDATVEKALQSTRRRCHCTNILTSIEEEKKKSYHLKLCGGEGYLALESLSGKIQEQIHNKRDMEYDQNIKDTNSMVQICLVCLRNTEVFLPHVAGNP